MAAQSLFGKDQFAVNRHFKLAAARWDQPPRTHKDFDFTFTQNFVRQTDGAWSVISNRTIFNLNIQERELHDFRPFHLALRDHYSTDIGIKC
jgi:hypothetical protein